MAARPCCRALNITERGAVCQRFGGCAMPETDCVRCGDAYTYAERDEPSLFTTITASFHDGERGDFSFSVCEPCGDELLADAIDVLEGIDA